SNSVAVALGTDPAALTSSVLIGLGGLAMLILLPGPTLLTAAVVALAYVFYLPFWRDFIPPTRNIGLEEQSYADFWDFGNIFGLFLFVAIPFVFALWRRTLQGPARRELGRGRVLAMWAVAVVVFACWVLSIPAVAHLLPASLGVQGSLRLGLAALAVLAFSVALQRTLTSSQRIAAIMLSFAFAIIAGTDVIYVWDRMNTIFKFYLEAWSLLAAATAVAIVDLWQGVIRSRALRRAWQIGTIALLALAVFTASTGVWAVVHTNRVDSPRPTLDGTAYLPHHSPHDRAAYEWLNDNVGGIPVIAEAYGPSYQEFARVAMNTGLPTVLGWDYHVHQRAQRWPDINKRKDDLKKLYSSDNKQMVSEILKLYHVS